MSRGGNRGPGTPKDGQPKSKAATGVYRSIEGALGQAWRTSRRNGFAPVLVERNGDGEFRVRLVGDPEVAQAGWNTVARVDAV